MPRFNRYKFVVESNGFPFPVDMLRYDACYPVDSNAVQAITESFANERPRTVHRVTLIRAGETPPTEGRWNSFQWRVSEVMGFRA